MADPLSITASVLTLLQVAVQVTVLVKQFRDEVNVVDATLTGLINDVDGFQRVLESMKDTFDRDDIKSDLQATGIPGNHFKNLARSLNDGASTLQQLQALLENVNKKTSILDAPRKQLRLKSSMDQIATYREQIQSYRAALQLSLSTIILWNQVTLQKSTEKIPEKITPTLDKLYDEFRTFGARLNAKIEQLQASVAHQSEEDEDQLNSMKNLKECVQAAAEVASTASTTLQAETSDRLSVKYGSDFGDIFVKDANVPMLRWMASHTVHEFEEMGSPFPDPSEASTGDATTEYQSDSDSDIENDLMRSLFNEGKTRKEENDVHGAIKHFRNCLTRFSSNGSYVSLTSLQSVSTCGVSKAELLDHLTDSYCLLASWSKAKITMVEKLSITERQVGKKDELFLWDTIRLAEIMLNNKEYVESHLQARRSLRGFKKLGEPGYKGYEKCLALLIQLCKEEGKEDEEDAYAALLGNHKRKTRPSHQSSDRPSQLRAPRTSSHQDDRDAAGSSTPEATKEFREEGQVNPTTKSVENDGANPPFDSPSKSTENPRGVKKDIAKADVKPEPTTNVSELGKYRAHSLENALGISIGPHQEAREEMLQELSKRDLHGVGGGSPLSQQALYPTALETHQETNSRPWLHGALNGKIGTTEMMTSYMALTAESDRSVLKSDMISAVPTKDDSSTLHLLNKTAAEPGAIAVAEVESPSADNTSHHSQSPHHSHVKLLEEQPTPKPQPIWMSIDDTETTYTTPLPVIETQNMLFRVAAEEFGEKQNTKSKRRDVELLRMYCERFHGQSPYVQTIHHPGDGWACMVKINNTHGCRVSGLMFSDQARDAAISRACEMFISAADEEHLLNNTKLRDPSSDKEVIHPEIDRLEYKEAIPEFHDIGNTAVVASTSVPHITISSDDNSHTHQEHTVESVLRRSASDSEVGRRHTGTQDLDQIYAVNKTVAAIDAELRKLKEHHHSAARLPGAPSGDLESEWIPGDDQSTTQTPQWSNNCPYCDEDLTRVRAHEAYQHVYHTCAQIPKPTHHQEIDDTPSCPICDASLSGLSEEAVLIHVNGCIDAAPASVEPMHETEQVQRESNLSASRMSWDTFLNRYDSPEGTWACSVCKSDRLQPMQESCGSCFKQRADADPSSLNDFRRQPFDSYQTFLTSLNLDLLTTSDGKVVRRKVLLLGDTLCGKTYLASAWSHNAAPATNAPMVNNFMKVIKIEGGREVELVIWDSTCMDGYERLRRLSYGDVHVILVCFDISEPDSLDNVEHMWNPEANDYLRDIPKILVGCKKDCRSNRKVIERLQQRQMMPVSPYAGDNMAHKIQALAYFETSANERKGLNELFEYAAEAALKTAPKKKIGGLRRFLSRSEISFPAISGQSATSPSTRLLPEVSPNLR